MYSTLQSFLFSLLDPLFQDPLTQITHRADLLFHFLTHLNVVFLFQHLPFLWFLHLVGQQRVQHLEDSFVLFRCRIPKPQHNAGHQVVIRLLQLHMARHLFFRYLIHVHRIRPMLWRVHANPNRIHFLQVPVVVVGELHSMLARRLPRQMIHHSRYERVLGILLVLRLHVDQ